MAGLAAEDGGLPIKLIQMAGANTAPLESGLETALGKLPKVEGGSGLSLSTAAAKTFANAEKRQNVCFWPLFYMRIRI